MPLSAVGDAEVRSQLASMDVDLLQEWLSGEQEARSVYQRWDVWRQVPCRV